MREMPINLKIVLIEDQPDDAEVIKKRFTETVDWLRERELLSEMKFDSMSIEFIKGSEKNIARGKNYFHYNERDISEIETVLQRKKENEKVGILTDILLDKKEVERARVNDFAEIEMVNKICKAFEDKCHMYFITGLLTFGSRAWSILGKENMCNRYIQKDLIDIPSRKAIARAIYWLANGEQIPTDLAEKIEEREIEEKEIVDL